MGGRLGVGDWLRVQGGHGVGGRLWVGVSAVTGSRGALGWGLCGYKVGMVVGWRLCVGVFLRLQGWHGCGLEAVCWSLAAVKRW